MEEVDAFQKALEYLYSFVDFSLTRAFRYSPEKFDLGRVAVLLKDLGDPQEDYAVIHVAGTKGKGSTAAMIASALRAGGYHTGFYTSPHMQEYTERIQVDGKMIAQDQFVDLIEEMKPQIEKVQQLSSFEIGTALAFLYFSRQDVDVAVVEVGLGGRLDSTNVVDPLISVITSISYDHTYILGNTLTEIAGEKAGIIKPGRPVVIAPQKSEALRVFEQVSQERKAPLTQVGKDYLYTPREHSLDGQSLLVWPAKEQARVDEYIESGGANGWEPLHLTIPLLGLHQMENAATAYAALDVSRSYGIRISEQEIRQGFSQVFWPGRFEVLSREPVLIIDSAHNRNSALRLRLTLDDYLPSAPVILIFGASEDKDVSGIFSELMPRVQTLICTESFHPRAMEAQKLVELAHTYGCPAQAVVPVEKALERAVELAGREAAIVAAGSVFIAGGIRDSWRKMGHPVQMFQSVDEK